MEQEWLRLAQLGDKRAFNQLLEIYTDGALRTAYLLLQNRSLAEDALQEALIETYRCMKRFDEGRASFKTWFHTIVIRSALRLRRKQLFSLQWSEWMTGTDLTYPESQYLLAEEYRALYDAIRGLSYKHRLVIVLFYFEEFTIQEIAEVADIKVGTVKSRLYQAREKLKQHLQTQPEELERRGKTWIGR